jgi:hypothetical protein
MVVALIACCYAVILRCDMSARYRAQDNVCMSNVKQLGLGLEMYAADNNFRLPRRGDDWGAVYPYVKNVQIFLDPRAPRRPEPPERLDSGAEEASKIPAGGSPSRPPASFYSEESPTPLVSDYLLNPTAQSDDPPETILAGDDAPDRHRNREWIGVRADGAVAYYPAAEWQSRLKQFADAGQPPARTGGSKDERSN